MCLTVAGAVCGWAAEEPSDSFYQAIRNDNVGALRAMLAKGAAIDAKDRRGTTPLMYAAAFGSLEAMKVLLEKGADVNAKNAFDATALMWAVYDLDKVRLLVEKGANVNARSKQGRTPLIIAATYEGNAPVVKLMLEKGAGINARDETQTTPLLAAVDMANAKLLVDKGADVNVKDGQGITPLMNAAGGPSSLGNVAWAKLLLAKGADVNAVSAAKSSGEVKNGPIALGLFTPLLLACAYGPAELVELLLDAGAKVNVRDVRGMTPLMLAIASDRNDARIVKLLLNHGADPKIKSTAGEDAFVWAQKFGDQPDILSALGMKRSAAREQLTKLADYKKTDASTAVRKSMDLLVKASSQFFAEGGCVSCHAQNMTALAVAAVRGRGLKTDEAAASEQAKATLFGFGGFEQPMLQRMDPPGGSDTLMYSLLALDAGKQQADRVTDAMVFNMVGQQHAAGDWGFGGVRRPPIEDGGFSRTALCIRAMQVYGMPGRKAELDKRIARGRDWLLESKPRTTEDANMRLLGLKWTNVEASVLEGATRDVLALQRPDGGWSQTPDLAADAYATGQALYALSAAGVAASDPAYQRGVAWLLKTQLPDGSWHVASRAPKFQPYFESGFPHGHDQWISAMATGWAVMGLSPAVSQASADARRSSR